MYHNRVVCLIHLLVPDLLKNLVGAEYFAWIRCQQIQDVELDRGQLNLLVVDRYLMVVLVDGEAADADLVFDRLVNTAVRV